MFVEMELEKDEVIDFSGESFNKKSIPCSVGLITMLLVALINMFLMFLFPGTFISTFVRRCLMCSGSWRSIHGR